MEDRLGMARVTTPRCVECGKTGTVLVQMSDFIRWTSSKHQPLIQDCFPTLSDELREQMLTGTHPECWEKIFPPEEVEEFGGDELYPIIQGEPPHWYEPETLEAGHETEVEQILAEMPEVDDE